MTEDLSGRALLTSILLATDGSASAKPAQELALTLAQRFHAVLHVVAVLEFESWRDLEYRVNQLYLEDRRREVRDLIAAVEREARAVHVTVVPHEPIGAPSQEIVALAASEHADLIVLGTHGRTGLDHVLIGSTAERVLRTAPCPVVTVRSGIPTQMGLFSPSRAFDELLVAVDFSECSLEAVEYAAQLGERFGSTLTLLHVVEPVAYGLDFTLSHALTGAALRADVERSMSGLVEAFKRRGLTAHQEILPGLPADVIPRVAVERRSDALVIGTHGRRGWSHFRFGSVAEAVARHAKCPVFAVRSPKFQTSEKVGTKR
ncbi:universal stress protein [Nitrospira sp.]|nr:universal stress protein [Nitrospira sp.]